MYVVVMQADTVSCSYLQHPYGMGCIGSIKFLLCFLCYSYHAYIRSQIIPVVGVIISVVPYYNNNSSRYKGVL